jgi:hypothetical protein
VSPPSLHKTFNAVVRQSGRANEAALHPWRPSDATPRLERGVSWRVMQARLGHKSPSPTARSTPLRPPTCGVVPAPINARLAARSGGWRLGLPEVADVWRRDGREDLDR